MELKNEFEVGTGLERAWEILTDVERIAPCLPGAELREIEGDEYRGVVKVKVGPITAEYRGAAHFLETNAKTHTAVLRAEGREARGQGNASATITAVLESVGEGTKVSVVTDLSISGKVAQFGRGVLAEVSAKLLEQFVQNLESTVLADQPASGGAGSGTSPGKISGAAEGEGSGTTSLAEARTTRRAGARSKAAGGGESDSSVADEGSRAEGEAKAAATGAAAKAESASKAEGGGKAAGASKAEGAAAAGAAGKGGRGSKADSPTVVDAPDGASRNGQESAAAEDASGNGATVRRLEPRPADPVDLIEFAGPSFMRRFVPAALAAVGLAALALVVRRLLK